MTMNIEKTIDEIRLGLLNFAREMGGSVALNERGEVGFGRPCVGFVCGSSYVDIAPSHQSGNFEAIEELHDPAVDAPATVDNAYHKHDCLCVLVHGDDYDSALRELWLWVEHINSCGGGTIVTYHNGATGLQMFVGGIISHCIVSKPFWDNLRTRKHDLPTCIPRDQFA